MRNWASFVRAGLGSVRRPSLAGLVLAAVATTSCSSTVRTGDSPAYLVMTELAAASGAGGSTFSTRLNSDVQTGGGVFADDGRVSLVLGQKDITSPLSPNNYVTVYRYRVEFKRADGRNTPGVDVPYPFDGGVTFTVTDATSGGVFPIVRVQSKLEEPLLGLRFVPGRDAFPGVVSISTIAEVTFYGRDQVGNEVAVSGSISVNFADWADPE